MQTLEKLYNQLVDAKDRGLIDKLLISPAQEAEHYTTLIVLDQTKIPSAKAQELANHILSIYSPDVTFVWCKNPSVNKLHIVIRSKSHPAQHIINEALVKEHV